MKHFQEMKGLKSFQWKAKAHLQPNRASIIKLFLVNILLFSRKTPSQMVDEFL